MNSKHQDTFFKKTKDENAPSNSEEIQANTIKMLDDAARLGIESTQIGEQTNITVYEQDKRLLESKKQLIKTNNHLNKGDASLRNMEDACRCVLF